MLKTKWYRWEIRLLLEARAEGRFSLPAIHCLRKHLPDMPVPIVDRETIEAYLSTLPATIYLVAER